MSAASKTGWKRLSSDQRLLAWLGAAILVLIVLISVLAPSAGEDDPKPSTYNHGPHGVKAAYLTLGKLGWTTVRWTRPLNELDTLDARQTTLVLADPTFDMTERNALSADVQAFLDRGGHVLATGATGALLLPHGATKAPSVLHSGLCMTTPEGPGPLAQAGSVELDESVQWAGAGPLYRVAQRCGIDPVVVRYPVGNGEVVWWSSAGPMENAELKQDTDLKLLLASLDDGADARRQVVFDEALHGVERSLWDAAKGLPLRWISLQSLLLFALLVASFSRRRGPVRMPVALPRSSPVEFASSMGSLYEKGGATTAATDAARRLLIDVLTRQAGLSPLTIAAGPDAVAEDLHLRLGGDWSSLAAHLRATDRIEGEISMGNALALVRALSEDREAVRRTVTARTSAVVTKATQQPQQG